MGVLWEQCLRYNSTSDINNSDKPEHPKQTASLKKERGAMGRDPSKILTALNQGVGVVVWGEGGGQLQRLHAAPHTKVDIERTAGEEIYGR